MMSNSHEISIMNHHLNGFMSFVNYVLWYVYFVNVNLINFLLQGLKPTILLQPNF